MAKTINIDPREIIGAARVCLQQKGLGATTLKDVAEEAGVTQGTVYYHFKTKEELMSAVIQASVDQFIDRVDRAWDSSADPLVKIKSAIRVAGDAYGKDDNFHRLFYNMVALGLHNEKAAEEFSRLIRAVQIMIEQHCQEIQELAINTRIPPEHLSRIILAVINGLALQSIFNKDMDLDGVYDSYITMLELLVQDANRGDGE